MTTETTDTPRTDLKELESSEVEYPHDFYALADLCRQLERELAASQAEVAMLRSQRNDLLLELKAALGEVARLRKYVEKLEIYSPENEWSQPEWRKLSGSKEENEDPETLFQLYQFRIATAPEEADQFRDITKMVSTPRTDAIEFRHCPPRMARSIPSLVKPKLLVWARESVGLSLTGAAERTKFDVETLRAWESDDLDTTPSIAQLRKLGEAYKRPIAVFFLSEPPQGFRTQLITSRSSKTKSPTPQYGI